MPIYTLHQKIDRFRKLASNDEFTDSYIDTALWNSTGPGSDMESKNLDTQHLAPECKAQLHQDCQLFQRQHAKLLEEAYEAGASEERMGRDFWFGRNWAGTGFGDGHIPYDLGAKLTLAAHQFGEMNLYLGDDGLIYCTPIKLLN